MGFKASSVFVLVVLVDEERDFLVEVVEDAGRTQPVGFRDSAVVSLFGNVGVIGKY